ncbi:hypothetical protein ABPG72_005315 [Tetrahymena utriculariae]
MKKSKTLKIEQANTLLLDFLNSIKANTVIEQNITSKISDCWHEMFKNLLTLSNLLEIQIEFNEMDLSQRQCAQRVVNYIKDKQISSIMQNQCNLDQKSFEKLTMLVQKGCCKLKGFDFFKNEEIIDYALKYKNLEKKTQEITVCNELRLGIRRSFVCQQAYCTFHIKSTDWIQKKQILIKQDNFSFDEKRGKSLGQSNNYDKDEQLNTFIENYLQEFIYPSPKNGQQLLPSETQLLNDDEQIVISFDWSQDILFPKYRTQPAKLYFMQKKKCGLFVIIDEKKRSELILQNFDLTFLLLYHYLTTCIKKSKRLIIQMDNCSTINKNNYAFQFFYYLVHSLKLFEEIVICFLVIGHTKFTPDQWFGTIKKKINNYTCELESYPQIIKIINSIKLIRNQSQQNDMEDEQNDMEEERKVNNIIVHYSTSRNLDPQNFVKVFDWKEKLNDNFIKVTSEIKYFQNCYYRIHKKFEYIELKQKSDDENINNFIITKNNIEYANLELSLQEKQLQNYLR